MKGLLEDLVKKTCIFKVICKMVTQYHREKITYGSRTEKIQ